MSNVVNIESLTRAAQTYNPVLQTLPFEVFDPVMRALGVNVMEVSGKDTRITHLRKGNISKPYSSANDPADHYASELGKMVEKDLEVNTCVAALKDHILNYVDKNVITNAADKVDHKTKKHPLEKLILEDMVRTIAEDVILAAWAGERDEDNLAPLGMVDGFDTLITAMIAAGEITGGKGNKIDLGENAFAAPVDGDDYTAWDNLVKFVRSTNDFLRENGILYLPQPVIQNAQDALGNKIKYKDVFDFEVFKNALKNQGFAGSLKIATHRCIGKGDRVTMSIPGNYDLGVNTKSDMQFVRIRDIYEDPNLLQFWSQWDLGSRIRNTHEKTFATTDGTPSTNTHLSGDYS